MSYFDFVAIIELLSVGLLVITVSVAAGLLVITVSVLVPTISGTRSRWSDVLTFDEPRPTH